MAILMLQLFPRPLFGPRGLCKQLGGKRTIGSARHRRPTDPHYLHAQEWHLHTSSPEVREQKK